jgi:activator of 2-hydroxyglutaryl-CoA dehydratase
MWTIDAGVEHLRFRESDAGGQVLEDVLLPNHGDLRHLLDSHGLLVRIRSNSDPPLITGKLASTMSSVLGSGTIVRPATAVWLAAQRLVTANGDASTIALIDLSASGYMLVGIDEKGNLSNDLLVVNPRCGAGSGINLDRVLQKLAIERDRVDEVLAPYLGEAGRARRQAIGTRADRCGVFASSATISDKNQGIPIEVALATTLKSEVLKACRKLPAGFNTVYLLGRVFRWAFARDCAGDFLAQTGVVHVRHDPENTCLLEALAETASSPSAPTTPAAADSVSAASTKVRQYDGFVNIRQREEAAGRYVRLTSEGAPDGTGSALTGRPLLIGLDVGSTMAKAVFADGDDGTPLYFSAYSNAGDTMETVKCVLRDLGARGFHVLQIRGIGVTGSARYQVQQAMMRIYPSLANRLTVLVENYAHARGSIDLARAHVQRLAASGVDVNRQFCALVDIGGEDTKVSTIALDRAELFANAMNVKCSAGTGSLMDTLAALFGLSGVAAGCAEACSRPRACRATRSWPRPTGPLSRTWPERSGGRSRSHPARSCCCTVKPCSPNRCRSP